MKRTALPCLLGACSPAALLVATGVLSSGAALADVPSPPSSSSSPAQAAAPVAPSPNTPPPAPAPTEEPPAPPPSSSSIPVVAPPPSSSMPVSAPRPAEEKTERPAEAAPKKKHERPAWYGPAMIAGGVAWFASSYIPYALTIESSGQQDGLLFVPIIGNVARGADGIEAIAEGRATLGDGLDTAIAIWAGVGQVVGLVFLTAGVVLTVQSAQAPASAPTHKAAWSLSPAAGPGWGSLTLTGPF